MLDLKNIESIKPNVYYSVKQSMDLLGVSRSTFYNYVNTRKLKPSFHKTNHQYFKGENLIKFLKNFY